MHEILKNLREEAERRAAAEKSLAESKNLLESILTQAQCGILVVDADGKILFINDAARRILRKGPGESLELRSCNPEDPGWDLCVSKALRGAITESREEHVVVDGESFDLLLNSAPLRDSSGEIVGVVVSFLDITERKRLEDELRRYTTELERIVEERTEEIEEERGDGEVCLHSISRSQITPDNHTRIYWIPQGGSQIRSD